MSDERDLVIGILGHESLQMRVDVRTRVLPRSQEPCVHGAVRTFPIVSVGRVRDIILRYGGKVNDGAGDGVCSSEGNDDSAR